MHPRRLSLLLSSLLILAGHLLAADRYLVENGQPRAQIVIADNPPRSTRLAAQELQDYIVKISGAKLPIVNEASADLSAKIYVGRSPQTDKLKINAEGLNAGAYRIVSGDDWLALIGDDTDFTPIEPWAKNNGEIANGKLQGEWEKISGSIMGVPNAGMYKDRIRLPGEIGRPTAQAVTGKLEPLQLWSFDERGSFNAVDGFLQGLGVRWYLPGELGEVVPSMKSIALPRVDTTVQPDFPVRQVNFRFGVMGPENAMWAMRLGLRDASGLQTAHGMNTMTHREEIFRAHPDWFALYGGKRQTQPGQRLNQLCYSNEELFQETVRYVRTQFDHYKTDVVSIMPPDGYSAICQCPLCQGKDTPDRGHLGLLSDYVWDFVNRVAREVRKSHPDRMVSNAAYGAYALPPLKIEKLEPNVQVIIVGGRRPTRDKPEQQEEVRQLRDAWVKKTNNPILVFENYPFTDRGWYLPSFVAHSLGATINETKGISNGEDIWLSMGLKFDKADIGFNHFMVYFTARMYWGGKTQDVDAMFREYCRLFYGPAENEMRAFFEYSEANWQEIENDKGKADAALALFSAAQKKAAPDSVYARRLALIDDYLKGLRNKSGQLAQQRGPVPFLRLVGDARGIVVDGQLDDAYWQDCPGSATGSLRELQTGRRPTFGTSVKVGWQGGSVYFAIRCDDARGEKPNVTSAKRDDSAIWYGDAVEILLETESHSYYQIAINPAGVIADLDRSAPRNAWGNWDAQAEVATHIADDHWSAEIRIPVTEDDSDPLHQVIGHRPTPSLPWHINICRQRIRESGAEYSAFSPTGIDSFHRPMKFAHFYGGKSHQFEAAEPEPDFLNAFRTTSALATRGKYDQALPAFTAMADGKITDFQKSAALEEACASARAMQKHDLVGEMAARIPIVAVRKVAQMENLLALRKAPQLIEQFGSENIQAWPFWKAGDGYSARGRGYAEAGDGPHAEADLLKALDLTSDDRARAELWLAIGNNREKNLKSPAQALAAYREIAAMTRNTGTATYFRGIQLTAQMLNQEGKHTEAEVVLRKVNFEGLRGTWRGTLLLALADTLRAAGRKDEALAGYRALLADETLSTSQQKSVKEAVEALEK